MFYSYNEPIWGFIRIGLKKIYDLFYRVWYRDKNVLEWSIILNQFSGRAQAINIKNKTLQTGILLPQDKKKL